MSIPDNETAKNTFPGETDQQKKQSYVSWIKDFYNTQYESWMPWIEDQYLRWFGRGDNKASYATKDSLSKTKIAGIDQVDQLQDDTANVIGNQIGDRGLLRPVGEVVSKEGINRAERGGKDESGSYMGGAMESLGENNDERTGVGSLVSSGKASVGSVVGGEVEGAKGLFGGNGKL